VEEEKVDDEEGMKVDKEEVTHFYNFFFPRIMSNLAL
jgi:hypothetical protein